MYLHHIIYIYIQLHVTSIHTSTNPYVHVHHLLIYIVQCTLSIDIQCTSTSIHTSTSPYVCVCIHVLYTHTCIIYTYMYYIHIHISISKEVKASFINMA